MATPRENKHIVLTFSNAVKDTGLQDEAERAVTKTKVLDAVLVEDYVDNDRLPGQGPGRDGLWHAIESFCDAFPDQHLEVTHLLAEEDLVVLRGIIHATHRGALLGIPASHKRVAYSGTRLFRLKDGRLTEGWFNFDGLGLFQQIGAVPKPPNWDPNPPIPIPPVVHGHHNNHQANKEIMRRMIEELWTKGDLSVADEIFHPQSMSPSAPTIPVGPAGVKMLVQMFRSAFPDYWMRITHMVAEGSHVAARFEQGGTHKGDLMGIPATGKEVKWTEQGIIRVGGGQILESWYDVDMLGLMGQLGVGGT